VKTISTKRFRFSIYCTNIDCFQPLPMKFAERYNSIFGYAWWRDLEGLREKQKSLNRRLTAGTNDRACIRYYPDYRGNPYQNILYQSLIEAGWSIEAVDLTDVFGIYESFLESFGRVFHIHWLLDIFFQNNEFLSRDLVSFRIAKFISIIRMFKCIGVKIVWTVHNKTEHDLPEYLISLNVQLVGEIVKLADLVIVHLDIGIREIEEFCGIPCRYKTVIIEHPLYEGFRLNRDNHKKPREMHWKAHDKYGLVLGMIRPYKNLWELINIYEHTIMEMKNVKFVIAGTPVDRRMVVEIKTLADKYSENLLFIPRRLEENEVNYLYANCHFSLITCRNVLTSGSYYMAATHSKCSLVPRTDMFNEVVKDGINGYMYDDYKESLLRKLRMLYSADSSKLAAIGRRAREYCKYSSENFSNAFYTVINDLK